MSVRLLASVTDAEEAVAALAGGAELVDAKDPARGPLGALRAETVAAIVAAVAGRAPVSATLGHDREDVAALLAESAALAGTGVRYLKVGVADPGRFATGTGPALHSVAGLHRLVVVVLVDRFFAGSELDLERVDAIAATGACGLLLDTHDKRDPHGAHRTLRDLVAADRLARVVARAHALGLLCGFAGGLGLDDVAPLAALGPDLLGFRGALCAGEERRAALLPERVRAVRAALDAAPSSAPRARAAMRAAGGPQVHR